MKRRFPEILCAVIILCGSGVSPAFEAFVVSPSDHPQTRPDVDGEVIVWQQDMGANGWDIYGIDLAAGAAAAAFIVDNFTGDQQAPGVWSRSVVWQDNSAGDWDIYLTDIADPAAPVSYALANFLKDQTAPAIHGHTVAWQHAFAPGDADIYAADVTEPNQPVVYLVALTDPDQYAADQQAPAVYRNRLVWQDDAWGAWDIATADFWLKTTPADQWLAATELPQTAPAVDGDWVVWQEDFGGGDTDIYALDLSDPAQPVEWSLVADPAAQRAPDISGHLVVWEDWRHGNADIYGYNLITRREFRITTDGADQTAPAVSGRLVVWQDARGPVPAIYAARLDGADAADCPDQPAGDLTGDCRVNLADLAVVAETWLACRLNPPEACGN